MTVFKVPYLAIDGVVRYVYQSLVMSTRLAPKSCTVFARSVVKGLNSGNAFSPRCGNRDAIKSKQQQRQGDN